VGWSVWWLLSNHQSPHPSDAAPGMRRRGTRRPSARVGCGLFWTRTRIPAPRGSWARSRAASERPRSLALPCGTPGPRAPRRTRVTLVSHLCGLCIVRDQDVARPVGLLNACAKCAATAAAVPTAARTAAAPRTDAPLDHTTGQKATLRARESPQAGAPATTDAVQSITDVGLTTCLSIPSSLGSRPSARPTSWGRCRTGNPSSRPT
jgi:bacterioferritin-associated ferredoxin